MTLRIMDAGGQAYFDFLKPVLMQDRAIVILCVNGRTDQHLIKELREYLDILSTLMQGGVVIPVVTHLDLMSERLSTFEDRWKQEVVPALKKYDHLLTIDPALTMVSSLTREGLDSLTERLRYNISKVGVLGGFPCSFVPATFSFSHYQCSLFLLNQLPETRERFRPCFIRLATALLEKLEIDGTKFLPLGRVFAIAEECGFRSHEETLTGLRVMEKVGCVLQRLLVSWCCMIFQLWC